MKKTMLLVLLLVVMVSCVGCAKLRNKWASEGGFWASSFGGTQGTYIVISQSGGRVMDIWKLRNAIVQNEDNSDGWLFRDNDKNPVNLGGDVKVIRILKNETAVWDRYQEYHMELETQTYREKYTD